MSDLRNRRWLPAATYRAHQPAGLVETDCGDRQARPPRQFANRKKGCVSQNLPRLGKLDLNLA
jgi:hypothetical protein